MARVEMSAAEIAELHREASKNYAARLPPILTTVFARVIVPVKEPDEGVAHAAFLLEDGSYVAVRAVRCCETWHGGVLTEDGSSLKKVLVKMGW